MKTRIKTTLSLCLAACVLVVTTSGQNDATTISVENRILLNRLTLTSQQEAEVMLAVNLSKLGRALSLTKTLGGELRYINRAVGYLRVTLPANNLLRLVTDQSVEAFQLASDVSWDRDFPTRWRADLLRTPPRSAVLSPSAEKVSELPVLTREIAKQKGYTGDEGMGIEAWLKTHPTFDGRGVTIALLETALPEFSHPILGSAKTLDGREVNKLAGILNTIDKTEFDETRVALRKDVKAASTWYQIDGRTYVLPNPGNYSFGLLSVNAGGNLVQQFGVLRDQSTGEIWVDTDGDGDFSNEKPVVGIARKFEVRSLKITAPRKADLSFVVGTGDNTSIVHIYAALQGHQTMTMSIAAGSHNAEGLAYGVAPAARILLVRVQTAELKLSDYIEGYLAAVARTDVDILCDSQGVRMTPDTERDFTGLIFQRIVETYKKPIFHGVGNWGLRLASASSLGSVFSVGGVMSPSTFGAMFGGGDLPETIVHPITSAGPALDGSLEPDFLAPIERIVADVCTKTTEVMLPLNRPTSRLPSCYRIGGGTSAAGPFAAGVAALLISAAKQEHIDYSIENFARALRTSSRFMSGQPANEQGNGVLNIEGAWNELHRTVYSPRITVVGPNHHALTRYAAGGASGLGLFEMEGWTVGSSGTRTFQIRRDAGPAGPIEYKLSWTGNDGTFTTKSSVILPFGKMVSLPITIAPQLASTHSAILNIHDPATDAIVSRTMATVVVPERLKEPEYATRVEGSIPLLRSNNHFWVIPAGTSAISLDLTVKRGVAKTFILPSNFMTPTYYKYPLSHFRPLAAGSYHFEISNPVPGTWGLEVINDSSIWGNKDPKLVSTEELQYSLTARALGVDLKESLSGSKDALVITNKGSEVDEPSLKESWGTQTSYTGDFKTEGLPKMFEIHVPENTSALIVDASTTVGDGNSQPKSKGLDLYLYDCTTGECFASDFAIPATDAQRLMIRQPRAGRWVAMLSTPSFPGVGSYIIDAVVVAEKGSKTVSLGKAITSNETRTIPRDELLVVDKAPGANVLVYELFDQALGRAEFEHPWVNKEDLKKLNDRPVALGIAIIGRR